MRNKQDELLLKLQKCVGKIESIPTKKQQIPSYTPMKLNPPGYAMPPSCYVMHNQPGYTNKPMHTLPFDNLNQEVVNRPNISQARSTRNSVSRHSFTHTKYMEDAQNQCMREFPNPYAKHQIKHQYRFLDNAVRKPLREQPINIYQNTNSKPQPNQHIRNQETATCINQTTIDLRRNHAAPKSTHNKNIKQASTMEDEGKQKKISKYQGYDYLRQERQSSLFGSRTPQIGNPTKQKQINSQNIEQQIQKRDQSNGQKCRQVGAQQNPRTEKSIKQMQEQQMNIQQILDGLGNSQEHTQSKLKKIHEINDRINLRIKAIIDTFDK